MSALLHNTSTLAISMKCMGGWEVYTKALEEMSVRILLVGVNFAI